MDRRLLATALTLLLKGTLHDTFFRSGQQPLLPQWEKDGMRVKPLTSVLSRKGRGCRLPKLSCNNLLKGEETGVKPG